MGEWMKSPVARTGALLFALAALAAFCFPVHANSEICSEREILNLVKPINYGAIINDGWILRETNIDNNRAIRLVFKKRMLGEECTITIRKKSKGRKAFAETPSFLVSYESNGEKRTPTSVANLTNSIAGYIAAKDPGNLDICRNIYVKQKIKRLGRASCIGIVALIFAMPLFLLLISPVARQFLREAVHRIIAPSMRLRLALFTSVVLTGLVLRFAISPFAPVHENYHGVREMRFILSPESMEPTEQRYGRVYPGMMQLLTCAFGTTENIVYCANMVFGALSAISIFLLARALSIEFYGALISALLLAMSPAHVWLSGTESPNASHIFFLLTGLALLLYAQKKRISLFLWASSVLIVLSAMMKLITVFAIPLAVAFYLFGLEKNDEKTNRSLNAHAVLCLVFIAPLLVLHLSSIERNDFARGFNAFRFVEYKNSDISSNLNDNKNYNTPPLQKDGENNVTLPVLLAYNSFKKIFSSTFMLKDPTLVCFAVPFLSLFGFLSLVRHRRKLALLMGASAVMLFPPNLVIDVNRPSVLRYQSDAHWILFLIVGAYVSLFLEKHRNPVSRKKFIMAVTLFILAGSIFGLCQMLRGNEEISEYQFIRDTLSKHIVQPGATIALPMPELTQNHIISDFPDYISGNALLHAKIPDRSKGQFLVYIGIPCYQFMNQETEEERTRAFSQSGLRKECAFFCPNDMRSIATRTINATRPFWGYQVRLHGLSKSNLKIGFYKCSK